MVRSAGVGLVQMKSRFRPGIHGRLVFEGHLRNMLSLIVVQFAVYTSQRLRTMKCRSASPRG